MSFRGLCIAFLAGAVALPAGTAQVPAPDEAIVAEALAYFQQEYFQSVLMKCQMTKTRTLNGRLDFESEGTVVYAQLGREYFGEENKRSRSFGPDHNPKAKARVECSQRYNSGDRRVLDVDFEDSKPKPKVTSVYTREETELGSSREAVLANAGLQGIGIYYPLGTSYADLARTRPTRCSAAGGVIQSEYESIYGVCVLRVHAAQRTFLSMECVQTGESVIGINQKVEGRKLKDIRSASLQGSPKGLTERRSRWAIEWTLAGGRREIQSIRRMHLELAEPQLSERYETSLRVTSVKHDITPQEFEALKIPLADGQEVRVLGDETRKTPLALQKGEIVRVADGADLDKVLAEESTKRQRLQWLAYAAAGVGAVAFLFVISRVAFGRRGRTAAAAPAGPTP